MKTILQNFDNDHLYEAIAFDAEYALVKRMIEDNKIKEFEK